MKNYVLLFIVLVNVFPFNCFAQPSEHSATNLKTENVASTPNNQGPITSYHVVETVHSSVGSNITIYTVSHKSLISTNDLGPNNTRVITPEYAKAKAKKIIPIEQPKPFFNIKMNTEKLSSFPVLIPEKKETFVIIDVLGTYERLLEEGYKSIDMLKKVANNHYFKGNLILSAKWYSQLFGMTTDLEAVYYFRYAQSLNAVGQTTKSGEMMQLFESKKLIK